MGGSPATGVAVQSEVEWEGVTSPLSEPYVLSNVSSNSPPSMTDEWMAIAFNCLRKAEEWLKNGDEIHIHHFIKGEQTLKMIVEHKQLRLSRFDSMKNDSSEGKYASEVFTECIEDLFNLG